MKMSWKKLVVIVFVSSLVIVVSYATVRAYRLHNLRSHFKQVHVGQSQQEVVSLLGAPSEDVDCPTAGMPDDYARQCAKRFWYYGFLEEWIVDFDNQGRVIGAYDSVSP